VTIADGKTATGEEAPVENIPVVFYGKGASFVPISQYFKDLDSKNLLTWNVNSKLHSVRHKNGATIYYSTNMTVSDTVDFSKEDKVLLQAIADSINSYNLRVSGEHTEAKWLRCGRCYRPCCCRGINELYSNSYTRLFE